MLRRLELGRLAYHRGDEVHIAPVNYAVAGDHIVFRTAHGSKLACIVDNGDVAFEVDETSDEAATSVVCRGEAVELTGEQALMVDQLRLRPWVRTVKSHVVAIRVEHLSGRSFELDRPWLHLRQD